MSSVRACRYVLPRLSVMRADHGYRWGTIPDGRLRPHGISGQLNDILRCPFRKSYPDVLMVQPGQDWDGDNDTEPLDRPTQGRILAQRQVCARLIVIRRIQSKNSPQVRLAENQQSVQALAAHGADQAFRMTILPRRSRRDRPVADTHGRHPG